MLVIQEILSLVMLSVAIVGIGKLWAFIIYPGRIFGFIDKWIIYAEQKEQGSGNPFLWQFIYKSLGGCEICNRQRITELMMLGYILINPGLKWYAYLFEYMLLCGFVWYSAAAFEFMQNRKPIERKKVTTTL